MRLELGTFHVGEVVFGPQTRLGGGRLEVDHDELARLALQDPRLRRASIQLVRPREEARIVHVCDTIEPRAKVSGPGGVFPGFVGPIRTVGEGRTHRLAGVAVTTTAELPWRKTGGIQIPRESILDMSGPAATLNPFADLFHLVLELELTPDLPDEDCDQAVRVAGLRVAEHLGRAARDQAPDELEVYELSEADPSLPRVVYLCQITSQGPFAASFLYGGSLDRLLPTIVHPNELLDGALVGGNLAGPAIRFPTYFHQNNPIVAGLYRDHGRELTFAGVVLMRGHYYALDDKYRVAQQAAKLVRWLRADGAIATWENAGNALLEIMYTLQACEQAGVRTVLLTFEHGGKDGRDTPLQFYVPEAVAMVSTGSLDPPVELPRMPRVVGGETIRLRPETGGERYPAAGPLTLDWRLELFASANQGGWGRQARLDY